MSPMRNAFGSEIETPVYLDEQSKLMAKFVMSALETGNEQDEVANEIWKHLYEMSRRGMDTKIMAALSTESRVVSLMDYWIENYSKIVGVLVRIDEQALEPVCSAVDSFQAKVTENIGTLRHLWQERTGQLLSLQESLQEVEWRSPWVQHDADDGAYFLAEDALLPYVCTENDVTRLQLDSEHIDPETFRYPLNAHNVTAAEKELAN